MQIPYVDQENPASQLRTVLLDVSNAVQRRKIQNIKFPCVVVMVKLIPHGVKCAQRVVAQVS